MERWKVIVASAIVSIVVAWIVSDLKCGKHLKDVDALAEGVLEDVKKTVQDVVEYIGKKFTN